MAEHKWPSSLPCFALDGYSRGGDDGVLRTQFPAGVKTRRRFTSIPPDQVTVVIYCNRAQLQTLLDFYAITLQQILPFDHTDPTKPDDTLVEYVFAARPTYEPYGSGRKWRVTLQLEQLTTYQGTFGITESASGPYLTDESDETLTT